MKVKFLYPIANKLARFYPGLHRTLVQSRSKKTVVEVISEALFNALISSISVFVLFIILKFSLLISAGSAIFLFFIILNYLIKLPGLKIIKKRTDIDSQLIYALDHMIIRLRGGATLFDSIKSIAISNYGELSKDFLEVVKKIEGGSDEASVFEEYASMTPSVYLRKIMWELAMSVRSGGNVVNILESMAKDLVNKSEIEIKSYAGKLNLYLLMYMILSVVLPALFIIAMVISSIITGPKNLESVLIILPITVLLVQFVIIGMINSTRPTLWVGK